jgi:hypothetical protein
MQEEEGVADRAPEPDNLVLFKGCLPAPAHADTDVTAQAEAAWVAAQEAGAASTCNGPSFRVPRNASDVWARGFVSGSGYDCAYMQDMYVNTLYIDTLYIDTLY